MSNIISREQILNLDELVTKLHAYVQEENGKYQSSLDPYGVEYKDLFATQLLTICRDRDGICALSDVRRQCRTINGDFPVTPFALTAFATVETCEIDHIIIEVASKIITIPFQYIEFTPKVKVK